MATTTPPTIPPICNELRLDEEPDDMEARGVALGDDGCAEGWPDTWLVDEGEDCGVLEGVGTSVRVGETVALGESDGCAGDELGESDGPVGEELGVVGVAVGTTTPDGVGLEFVGLGVGLFVGFRVGDSLGVGVELISGVGVGVGSGVGDGVDDDAGVAVGVGVASVGVPVNVSEGSVGGITWLSFVSNLENLNESPGCWVIEPRHVLLPSFSAR